MPTGDNEGFPLKTLRCLISNIPQKLLSDIILGIAQQHVNIDVVGDASADDLPTLIQKESVDLLLIGMERNGLPQNFDAILDNDPELLIIGIVNGGRGATIFANDIGAAELEQLISMLGPARTSRHIER